MTTTLTPTPGFTTRSGTDAGARSTAAAPHRRRRTAGALGIEIAVMGTVFVAYRQVRHLTSGDTDQAVDNAAGVVALERSLHVFSERAVQRLVLHSELVVAMLNRYYVAVHFPATIAMLVWAFCRHRSAYGRIRAAFLGVTVAALVIHVLVPLAPPRMLAGEGFVDTLQVYGPRIYPTDTTQSVANQFAAMPSLHFGWSVLVAAGVIAVTRSRWRFVVLAHPALTLLAIVATANHYWLDAAVALVLVAVAGLVIRIVIHRRARTHGASCGHELRQAVRSPRVGQAGGVPALVDAHGRSSELPRRPAPARAHPAPGRRQVLGSRGVVVDRPLARRRRCARSRRRRRATGRRGAGGGRPGP
ncbi:MAG: phosphatase PAP2 family protein, partial [Ilumatobacteraceae bacterium]